MFTGNLLFTRKQSLRTAEPDYPAPLVAPLHNAGDDFTHAILVLFVDDFLLRIAHALNNHLLGGLRRNTAEVFHLQTEPHFIIKLDGRVMLAGFFKINLGQFVGDVVHHKLELVHFNIAGVVIVAHFHIKILAVLADHRGAHGVFERIDQHVALKPLVLADLVNGFFQLKIHQKFLYGFKPPPSGEKANLTKRRNR